MVKSSSSSISSSGWSAEVGWVGVEVELEGFEVDGPAGVREGESERGKKGLALQAEQSSQAETRSVMLTFLLIFFLVAFTLGVLTIPTQNALTSDSDLYQCFTVG